MKKTINQIIFTALLTAICMLPIESFAKQINKALFIGNSITAHAPYKRLKWKGHWGMAASSIKKDFVHQTYKLISDYQGFQPELLISGRNAGAAGKITNALRKTKEYQKIKADLIVVQLGENERGKEAEKETFYTNYLRLLKALRQDNEKAIIVCVGVWHPSCKKDWDNTGALGVKDLCIKEAAAQTKCLFVGTSPIGHIRKNAAWDQTQYPAGVKWHPGDAGMKAYAEAIFKTVKPYLSQSRKGNKILNKSTALTGIVPEPQELFIPQNQKPFYISNKTNIVVNENCGKLVKKGIELLQEDFEKLYGIKLNVVYKKDIANSLILLNDLKAYLNVKKELQKTALEMEAFSKAEAYTLVSNNSGALVQASDSHGVFYGVQSLRQLLASNKTIPAIAINDWPDQKWRIVYGNPKDPEWLIRKMARLKINMCIVESPWNAARNWWYNPRGKNLKAAKRFISLCREYGIEPVPLVQGLGWAYGVIDINPNCSEGIWIENEKIKLPAKGEILFPHRNLLRTASSPITICSESGKKYIEGKDYKIIPGVTRRKFKKTNKPWKIMRLANGAIRPGEIVLASYNYMDFVNHQSPYCPSEPETYKIVDRTLANVIKIFKPKYINIGHDEVIHKRRCGRCLKNGKTLEQLMGGDIQHWYKKIKELDPSIKIMMWDDLLRKNRYNGEIIKFVPKDVIICPWMYTATTGSPKRIESRTEWFIAEEKRPTIGTTSGYFLENIRLWRDECAKYSKYPNNLGFMFSYWGESYTLWSSLSFCADYMWSYSKPYNKTFNSLANANSSFRSMGLGMTLSFATQTKQIAAFVNKKLLAGGSLTDAAKLIKQISMMKQEIQGQYLETFRTKDLLWGTFPERVVSQLDRFSKLYWSMLAYANIKTAMNKGNISEADKLANQMFTYLQTITPERRTLLEVWKNEWSKNKTLPISDKIFGAKLKSISNLKLQGVPHIIDGVTIKDDLKGMRVYDLGQKYLLCRGEILSSPDRLYSISVSRDAKKWEKVASASYSSQKSGIMELEWEPRYSRYIRIVSNEPKEKIKAKIRFAAVKSPAELKAPVKTGDWKQDYFWYEIPFAKNFLVRSGNLAAWQTRAAIARDDKFIYVCFVSSFPAKTSMTSRNIPEALFEDDCVQFFIKPQNEDNKFYQVILNSVGNVMTKTHGFKSSKPVIEVKNKITDGKWTCSFAVPLSWFGTNKAAIEKKCSVNFTRHTTSPRELSTWSPLPANAGFWFLQPASFGKVNFQKTLKFTNKVILKGNNFTKSQAWNSYIVKNLAEAGAKATWNRNTFIANIPTSSTIGATNFQLYKFIDLEAGINYRMSLKIKVKNPLTVNILYILGKSPWTVYAQTKIKLVPGKENYHCILKPEIFNGKYQKPGSLRFFLGDLSGENISISNLELIRED